MSELGTSPWHALSEMDQKKYDAMSTDALKEILREDAEMPDSGKFGMDAILYIMEVVARREEENGNAPDVKAAWESFQTNYSPFSDNGQICDETPDTEAGGPSEDADAQPSVSFRSRGGSRTKRWLRVAAGVALVSVLLIPVNSVVADAFGLDIFRSVARWTQETFGFFRPDNGAAETQLTFLRGYLEDYGAADRILPRYIPEGYVASETLTYDLVDYQFVCCYLVNGDDNITLQYNIYPTELSTITYETRAEDPEIYRKGGVEHYIVINDGKYTAAWRSGNTECCIIGVSSRKELIRMIDSIYGG